MRSASPSVPAAMPRSALSFVAATASGAFSVMRAAQSRARSRSWWRGTISLSSPSSSARVADTGSAVSRNSIAAGQGIWRGSSALVPPLAKMPRRGSSMPNTASGLASRMSVPLSISIPPATHGPFTAAMIGL